MALQQAIHQVEQADRQNRIVEVPLAPARLENSLGVGLHRLRWLQRELAGVGQQGTQLRLHWRRVHIVQQLLDQRLFDAEGQSRLAMDPVTVGAGGQLEISDVAQALAACVVRVGTHRDGQKPGDAGGLVAEGLHEVCRQVTMHGLPRSQCRGQRDVADPRTEGIGDYAALGPGWVPGIAQRRVWQALASSILGKAQKLPLHEGHRGAGHVEQRTDLECHVVALTAAKVHRGQRLVDTPAPRQPHRRDLSQRMHQVAVRSGRPDAQRDTDVLLFKKEARDGQRLAGQACERPRRRRLGSRRPRKWSQRRRGHQARHQQARHCGADLPADRHPPGMLGPRQRGVHARSTDSHAVCSALSAASGVSTALARAWRLSGSGSGSGPRSSSSRTCRARDRV